MTIEQAKDEVIAAAKAIERDIDAAVRSGDSRIFENLYTAVRNDLYERLGDALETLRESERAKAACTPPPRMKGMVTA